MRIHGAIIGALVAAFSAGCSGEKTEAPSETPKPVDAPKNAAEPAAKGSEPTPAPSGGEVLVAGASDLVFAMEDLASKFEAETGMKVKFSPGSSGLLAKQIADGAPFDVFLSANARFVDDVVAAGSCDGATKKFYARGRIVLWSGTDGTPAPPAELTGLAGAAFKTIAIAKPDHAPYGAAAKQAMQRLGVWDKLEKRMVYGSNIKETMQFAETGNADIAVIALALAKKAQGAYVEIPADLHDPIDQAMVVCKGGKAEAGGRKFHEFVQSEAGRAVLVSFGFDLPVTN